MTDPLRVGAPSAGRPGILVVEDDGTLRELFRVALTQRGFEVRTAASGREAIALYKQRPPDLVLLDVIMPEMDGRQTLAELVRLDPNVRACLMSGHIGDYTIDDLAASGMIHFFSKPFSIFELTEKLWLLAGETAPPAERALSGIADR